jgi:hypothetical protein
MMEMWGRRKAREERERSDRREILDVGERQIHLSRRSLRFQVSSVAIAALGVGITLFAWHPWGGGSTPLHAKAKLAPGSHDAYVPHPVAAISIPPANRPSREESRCEEWWRHWFDAQDAAGTANPLVEVSAPATAAVTITRATVQVYRSYAPKAISYIKCATGYGPEVGTLLYVNLAHPERPPKIVADDGSETPLVMPNAVIDVEPGKTEEVALTPRGQPRMYEWSARLQMIVDQHEQVFDVGSARQPLRSWLGSNPNSRAYEFDEQEGVWEPAN